MSTVEDQAPPVQGDEPNKVPPRFLGLPPWCLTFLASYRKCGSVPHAARTAKVTTRAVRKRRACDPLFDARCKEAKRQACALLEREAWRRAVQGIDEVTTVTRKNRDGEVLAVETKVRHVFSDQILGKLLVANMPQKYSDKKQVETTIHDDRERGRDQLQAALKDPESRELLAKLAERQALLAAPGAPKDCTVQSITVVEGQPTHAQLAETTTCGKKAGLDEPLGGDEAGVQAKDSHEAEQPGNGG